MFFAPQLSQQTANRSSRSWSVVLWAGLQVCAGHSKTLLDDYGLWQGLLSGAGRQSESTASELAPCVLHTRYSSQGAIQPADRLCEQTASLVCYEQLHTCKASVDCLAAGNVTRSRAPLAAVRRSA